MALERELVMRVVPVSVPGVDWAVAQRVDEGRFRPRHAQTACQRWFRIVRSILIAALGTWSTAAAAADNCHLGAYRLRDGRTIDIAPSEGQTLRWRAFDGETGALTRQSDGSWRSSLGWTGRPDGRRITFSSCRIGKISFAGVTGKRLPLEVTDTSFLSHGVKLVGRLVLPPGRARVPIVILIHGAEHDSALDSYPLQRLFPAGGIGAFVYDKRGTGASGGHYTQDYPTLAADADAALEEARRLAGARAGRIGYQGGSQGGWVAPLATKTAPADFVIVSFGLAVSPIAEERESIEHDIRSQVSGPDGVKIADQFAAAIERVADSNFREGFDQLDAIRKRYGREAWFKRVGGEFARFLLDTTDDTVRMEGPPLVAGINLNYDPMPVLRSLNVPQLWLLGGEDRDAAPYETVRRLTRLRCAGRPITLAVYPKAEHGLYEFEISPTGERLSTRQPQSYFRLMRDFILKGRVPRHEANDANFPSCHSPA